MACQEEYRSGKFNECPNCECTEPGITIYKCKEGITTSESDHCGKVFCNECGEVTLMSFGHGGNEGCPSCGSFGSMIGEIKQEASEYDAEESEPDDDPDDSDYSSISYDSSSTSSYSSSNSSGSASATPANHSSSFGFFEFILVIVVIFADLTILSRCSSDKQEDRILGVWQSEKYRSLVEIVETASGILVRQTWDYDGVGYKGGIEYPGKYIDGKVVVVGNEKDFYKFELPTYRLAENGDLFYTCGVCMESGDRFVRSKSPMPDLKYSSLKNHD